MAQVNIIFKAKVKLTTIKAKLLGIGCGSSFLRAIQGVAIPGK